MDGKLIFRLILIVIAGFALVTIVSSYNTTTSEEIEQEQFQTNQVPYSFTEKKNEKQEVIPSEDGTLANLAGGTSQTTSLLPPGSIDTLKPEDLMPKVGNSPEELKFVNVNPSVAGDIGSQNFLHAGYWQGAITSVQKNANRSLRSDPLIVPQKVSPWMNTPFEMNAPNRPFEIGSVSSV